MGMNNIGMNNYNIGNMEINCKPDPFANLMNFGNNQGNNNNNFWNNQSNNNPFSFI
jgi:hypothetical protein